MEKNEQKNERPNELIMSSYRRTFAEALERLANAQLTHKEKVQLAQGVLNKLGLENEHLVPLEPKKAAPVNELSGVCNKIR